MKGAELSSAPVLLPLTQKIGLHKNRLEGLDAAHICAKKVILNLDSSQRNGGVEVNVNRVSVVLVP